MITASDGEFIRNGLVGVVPAVQRMETLLHREYERLNVLAQTVTEIRDVLRAEGRYELADSLRKAVELAGFYVEDQKHNGRPLPPHAYRIS